jgi:hypothetical protein
MGLLGGAAALAVVAGTALSPPELVYQFFSGFRAQPGKLTPKFPSQV